MNKILIIIGVAILILGVVGGFLYFFFLAPLGITPSSLLPRPQSEIQEREEQEFQTDSPESRMANPETETSPGLNEKTVCYAAEETGTYRYIFSFRTAEQCRAECDAVCDTAPNATSFSSEVSYGIDFGRVSGLYYFDIVGLKNGFPMSFGPYLNIEKCQGSRSQLQSSHQQFEITSSCYQTDRTSASTATTTPASAFLPTAITVSAEESETVEGRARVQVFTAECQSANGRVISSCFDARDGSASCLTTLYECTAREKSSEE